MSETKVTRQGRSQPDTLWGHATPESQDRGLPVELRPQLGERLAIVEAERCLECGGPYAPAPCTLACPAGIDVPGFVGAIARGAPDHAAEIIFAENLLGGTCARVCPVEVLCEGACVLNAEGKRPVEIGRLQRHATDHVFARGTASPPPSDMNGLRVAVIGGGPAGLTCAGELARRGYAVTVYETRDEAGGLARFAIAPYRQMREPLPYEVERIRRRGVFFALDAPVHSPKRLREIEENADAVVLAIGMGGDADVRFEGDSLRGVWRALPFIEALKTGSPPRIGDRVVVIGGGNTAVDVARESLRLGANDVLLLAREADRWSNGPRAGAALKGAGMPAFAHELDEARAEGVRVQGLISPRRFVGQAHLEGVECEQMRVRDSDAGGRHALEPVSKTGFVVPADCAIIAIGQRPRAEFLGWVEGLELDQGRVRIDPSTGRTTNPKYFAAGDCVTGGWLVVDAVRSAKVAARGVHRALRGMYLALAGAAQ